MASSDMTIDNLQIKIESDARKANKGIDDLAETLGKLKNSLSGSGGVATNLAQIANAIQKFSGLGRINIGAKVKSLTELEKLIPS